MKTFVATLALAALVAACATPTPTPSAATPAPLTVSPTTVPTAAILVTGTIREGCGSIGGCAYFINLDGDGGSWKSEFGYGGQVGELTGAEALPPTLAPGTYTLTLSSVMVSDVVLNGVRQFGPSDATCSTTLDASGDQPIHIQGTFDKGSCEVRASG